MPLSGIISDKFGRKTMLICLFLFSGTLGIVKAFSVNYLMFIIMEFFGTMMASGLYMTVFILAVELVGPKKRVLAGTMLCVANSLSQVIVGVAAMFLHNFRTLLIVLCAQSFVVLAYSWFIPESVRWLMSKGKYAEVQKIIYKAAKVNKVKLSNIIDELKLHSKSAEENSPIESSMSEKDSYPLFKVFKSKSLMLRLLNCGLCWFANTFIYYGLNVSAVSMNGNKYLNFTLISLAELPSNIITFFVMVKFGRKFPLCISMIIAGTACIACEFMGADFIVARLISLIIGKSCIAISFCVLYIYTSELFPTNLRQSLMNVCYAFGRFGTIAAPQTPLLVNITKTQDLQT